MQRSLCVDECSIIFCFLLVTVNAEKVFCSVDTLTVISVVVLPREISKVTEWRFMPGQRDAIILHRMH